MMRTLCEWIGIFCLLCVAFSFPAFSEPAQTEKAGDVDWSRPETIDPFREDIGDFLDVDLRDYAKKAYDTYQSKDIEEAAKHYLVFLRYDINNANSIYNLACCYGLLGKDTLAAKYLERSVTAGFENIEHIKEDPDFDKVRGKQVFDAVVDSIASQIKRKTEALGNIIHVDAPALFKCRIRLPKDYDSTKSYPLLVGLHGLGSNPDRFITLWEKFGKPDFIYASPQAPYPFSSGKEIGYSWRLRGPGQKGLGKKTSAMSDDYVALVVENLRKRYKIDEAYLLGFSQGCAQTYTTGLRYSPLFKGLICFGGWLDEDWLTDTSVKGAKGLRVFIAHGTEDGVVEHEAGIKAKDFLTKYGYDVTSYNFEGGHRVPEEAAKKAIEWMRR
ncbi:hypothetical protein E3J38_03245 [candidate division TA06 bacterium]|uniref:Phospholipase/carboxylesterase/thioesterase domain-containing protein n=1 Tax=candidate division TA06 bacterium TaxID=2250710 RepID=A0A523XR92_UNCT6|nr:MAG: hypothetical protein E3J38_03245 [candidate division TA06 bacterium]